MIKRLTVLSAVFLAITFGWVVAVHLKAGGPHVPVAKYPAVPDEAFLNAVTPDPDVNGGKICVSVEGNGQELGGKDLDVDFAPGAAPTWAKQAAVAKAIVDIENAYNAAQDGDATGTASASYVKYCYDCGDGYGCCSWDCHGVRQSGEPGLPPVCVDYPGGNCIHHKWSCPGSGPMNCGFCDYIYPP